MIEIVSQLPTSARPLEFPETEVIRGLRCPTRDGILLATDLVVPVRGSDEPLPVILVRTPYDKTAMHDREELLHLVRHGYIVAIQDCRGRFNSGGSFYPYIHETEDGFDAVQWLAAQEFCNGTIGMTGGSYAGQTCWFAAAHAPEALKAIAPVVSPPGDAWRNEPLWGGCFLLAMAAWTVAMGERSFEMADPAESLKRDWDFFDALPLETLPARARTQSTWWDDWMSRPVWDSVWERSSYEQHWPTIATPALNLTGWYDMNFVGSPRNFEGMRAQSASEAARRGQQLLIGPWHHHVNKHREMSGVDFGPGALLAINDYTLRFFDHWLKGSDNGLDQDPRATVFVMGARQWWASEDWPLPGTRFTPWYLHSQGAANSLTGDGTLSPLVPDEEAADSFRYDPRDPVRQAWHLYDGPVDDRVPSIREDVLVYTSEPLEEAVDVVGPVSFVLHAASSALDTDWHVRLVDVHPDGAARFLCHGALRARFRAGWDQPQALPPGEAVRYEIDMTATGNRFLAGHRIRIELSSSWLGRFDRNTNTGAPNIYRDYETVIAEQTIFHDAARPSQVILPIIPTGPAAAAPGDA